MTEEERRSAWGWYYSHTYPADPYPGAEDFLWIDKDDNGALTNANRSSRYIRVSDIVEVIPRPEES